MTVPGLSPYPEQSQATTILVLGILGIVCSCFPLGVVAWVMGNSELRAIEEGRRPPENRGTANAGRICGIVAVALSAVFLVFLLLSIAGSIAGSFDMPFIDDFRG